MQTMERFIARVLQPDYLANNDQEVENNHHEIFEQSPLVLRRKPTVVSQNA